MAESPPTEILSTSDDPPVDHATRPDSAEDSCTRGTGGGDTTAETAARAGHDRTIPACPPRLYALETQPPHSLHDAMCTATCVWPHVDHLDPDQMESVGRWIKAKIPFYPAPRTRSWLAKRRKLSNQGLGINSRVVMADVVPPVWQPRRKVRVGTSDPGVSPDPPADLVAEPGTTSAPPSPPAPGVSPPEETPTSVVIKMPIIDTAAPTSCDLLTEAVVGTVLNRLRPCCPNFMYTVGVFVSDYDILRRVSRRTPRKLCTYLVVENVPPPCVPVNLGLHGIDAEEMAAVVVQLFCALQMAQDAFAFVHFDLNPYNILLHKLARPVTLTYTLRSGTTVTVRARHLVQIIDFGTSRLEVDGNPVCAEVFSALDTTSSEGSTSPTRETPGTHSAEHGTRDAIGREDGSPSRRTHGLASVRDWGVDQTFRPDYDVVQFLIVAAYGLRQKRATPAQALLRRLRDHLQECTPPEYTAVWQNGFFLRSGRLPPFINLGVTPESMLHYMGREYPHLLNIETQPPARVSPAPRACASCPPDTGCTARDSFFFSYMDCASTLEPVVSA